jgi:TolA-binding protein
MIDWSRTFLARSGLVDPVLLPFVRTALRTGMWEKAEALAKQNATIPAAVAYAEFQVEFPKDPDADNAIAKGSDLYLSIGKGAEGITLGNLLIKTYPKSNLRADMLLKVAQAYRGLLEFESAAVLTATFVRDYPGDKRAPEIQMQAADYYKKADNNDAYTQQLKRLVKAYPRSKEAPQALYSCAETFKKLGDNWPALEAYSQYLSTYGRIKGNEEQALTAEANVVVLKQILKKTTAATKDLQKFEARLIGLPLSRGQDARSVVATYHLAVMEQRLAALPDMAVNYFNYAEFTKSVRSISKTVSDYEAGYMYLVKLGDAENSVAALYKLGTVYEANLRAFNGDPDDEALLADDVKKIIADRAKLVPEIRSKITLTFEQAVKLAKEREWYGSWQRLALKRMIQLQPNIYGEVPETQLRAEFTSHRIEQADAVEVLKR